MAAARPAEGAPPALPWPEVARGEVGPLYGLFGEEDFLVIQGLEAFLASPAFSQNPGLNIERFSASDTPPARVLESAQTLPFLGSRRLILVSEVSAYKAAQLAEFLNYLADPAPSTCLVFAGPKLDMRSKFAKELKKVGKTHSFAKLWPNQLPAWLQTRAQARGKRLHGAAAERLAELSGLGLMALDGEVEKLCLYSGKREEVSLDDVAAVTGRGRLYGIFDLTDALAAGELGRTLSALEQLSALGEPMVRVLAMVSRLYKQLLEAREVLDRGGDESGVQRALRTPPAATRTLTARARGESRQGLGRALGAILAADVALKSSAGSDRVIMERLFIELCGPKGRSAPQGEAERSGLWA